MSQGDIERSTGMLRAYISRVEHGHTVPSLGSLERFAAALDVPFYQLFREASEPKRGPVSRTSERSEEDEGFLHRCGSEHCGHEDYGGEAGLE
jgi:transcriptional regulator with XRE-family HTH domain